MSIRTVIADDEPLARGLIRSLLDDDDEIEVVAECADGDEAVAALRALAPDLVYLDVRMPGMSGLDAMRLAGDRLPRVILVTAYERHAIEAFELRAVDYLLKPLDKTRFADALARVKREMRRDSMADLGERLSPAGVAPGSRFRRCVRVRDGSIRRVVALQDVRWIEAANQYVRLHTATGDHLLSRSMSGLLRELDPRVFHRIHRSAIVNAAHVVELRAERNGAHVVVLSGGERLRLSRRRSGVLAALIGPR
ncbi:MAG TPA: LytTR family DNA-binding domain-containing protein [Candidatus Polarisedimenticolaceae bacterium]|nr:LytTR family DNA-binding domain-containing protein [Candidatus Polarisedimenticolaceae bacterium]